mmetsp:Transcript_61052/g.189286  ORF Transcript_61052/g.189286 Transcript_61052/m.189286 type:complete len:232 (+) Transcript_61052:1306-2001(+)
MPRSATPVPARTAWPHRPRRPPEDEALAAATAARALPARATRPAAARATSFSLPSTRVRDCSRPLGSSRRHGGPAEGYRQRLLPALAGPPRPERAAGPAPAPAASAWAARPSAWAAPAPSAALPAAARRLPAAPEAPARAPGCPAAAAWMRSSSRRRRCRSSRRHSRRRSSCCRRRRSSRRPHHRRSRSSTRWTFNGASGGLEGRFRWDPGRRPSTGPQCHTARPTAPQMA